MSLTYGSKGTGVSRTARRRRKQQGALLHAQYPWLSQANAEFLCWRFGLDETMDRIERGLRGKELGLRDDYSSDEEKR
jgi:hypothetical protein